MSRQTIDDELKEELDDSHLNLLTTLRSKVPKKSAKGNPVNASQKVNFQNSKKLSFTVRINQETVERVKDCVYWNRSTIAHFVEEALENALREAEKENGKPFSKRRSELKSGRPIK